MTEFTASNGLIVTPVSDGLNVDRLGSGFLHRITTPEVAALREFFRVEEDERLGRWRYNDHVVVYPHKQQPQQVPGRGVVVMDERTPRVFDRWESRTLNNAWNDHETQHAASAYFDAHPEPKPWHDAKEGELWAIVLNGTETPMRAMKVMFREPDHPIVFLPLDRPGATWVVSNASTITAGRRIWPEE